jgi:integrase/recombinase XerD
MNTLRERMDDAMVLRGFSLRTRQTYLECVGRLARYYRRPPDLLGREEIQAYLLHMIRERKLAYSTVNQATSAFRFLFSQVLERDTLIADVAMAKVPTHLPHILPRADVRAVIAAAATSRARAVLATTYAAGLRLSEVCHLQVGDIESAPDRMCIKVRQGKGGKDRYTLLSARLLAILRQHWLERRPRTWLFPNPAGDGPMGVQTAQRMYRAAADAAGLHNAGSIHTLRHCFATHLLEAGVDIHTIQRLLGHGHVGTTMRYFHLAQGHVTGTVSPFELLNG